MGEVNMEYFDEELLETKRALERQNYTTLETGMYAGEELITFTDITLPDSAIHLPLPDQFIVMPTEVKQMKYPSVNAPYFIVTSLDSTVNIGFNILPAAIQEGEEVNVCTQFRNALTNLNPMVTIKNPTIGKTNMGNEMAWLEYKGYHLDGQSYNRIYFIKLKKSILQGIFSCPLKDKDKWERIIGSIFFALSEMI